MLERATSCVKSGAVRDSLRCAQRATKSRRLLHSTFWNHGAGDLEIPPWAMSMFPMPDDLPMKHNDTQRAEEKRRRRTGGVDVQTNTNTGIEGAFLDFLYPQQALAWFQRKNMSQMHRWEKRNARRLPEGFILASRRYTSGSHLSSMAVAASTAVDHQSEKYDERQIPIDDNVKDVSEKHLARRRQEQPQDRPRDARFDQPMDFESVQQEDSAQSIPKERLAEDGFADSPADLADDFEAAKRLRHVMMVSFDQNSTKDQNIQYTMRLWQMYCALPSPNVTLKHEVVHWLSAQQNSVADKRCVELFDAMPISQRTLETYHTVLPVYLRLKNFKPAARLHREALAAFEQSQMLSKSLFVHAVDWRHWRLAMRTLADFEANCEKKDTTKDHHEDMWREVPQVPRLLDKAVRLVDFLRTKRPSHLAEPRTRGFCIRFFKAAIAQEFLQDDASLRSTPQRARHLPPLNQIRWIVRYLSDTMEKDQAVAFLEDTLKALLRPTLSLNYADFHGVVGEIYHRYTKRLGIAPPEWMLSTLLERAAMVLDTTNTLKQSVRRLTPLTVLKDWTDYHQHVSIDAVKRVMGFLAKRGDVDEFSRWQSYLESTYPDVKDHGDVLWSRIYIHAVRSDLGKAKEAFDIIQGMVDTPSDSRCWNSLLHAYGKADDLEGALSTLYDLVNTSDAQPNRSSFHKVLLMLARRGDVEGTETLLQQYDQVLGEKRDAICCGDLMIAHINNDDIQAADVILRKTLVQAQAGEVITGEDDGSLLQCFNILMTAYSMRRDIDATMRTYRWMKTEGIKPDQDTFAALIQGLAFYRRTDVARKIVSTVMLENGVKPSGFHHSIVIAGFVYQRMYKEAIDYYQSLLKRNIKPTARCRISYFRARTRIAHVKHRASSREVAVPLQETIDELERLMMGEIGTSPLSGQAGTKLNAVELSHSRPADFFDILIFTHGKRRCIDAVRHLYTRYKETAKTSGVIENIPPIRLLASLMEAHRRAREHADVEECWKLIKQYADKVAPPVAVPVLLSATADNEASSDFELDALNLKPSATGTAAPASKVELLESKQSLPTPKPSPRRKGMLSRALRYYLLSLCDQHRYAEAITTFSNTLNQGYTMSNRTWNYFIRSLCQASSPLALLAFVLSERFLVANFPGWVRSRQPGAVPQAKAEGLQHIRARYLAPGHLMPMYETLVELGAALFKMRRASALGRRGIDQTISPELARYVGTLKDVRKRAPKTLHVVQSMPRIPDRLQTSLLGRVRG